MLIALTGILGDHQGVSDAKMLKFTARILIVIALVYDTVLV